MLSLGRIAKVEEIKTTEIRDKAYASMTTVNRVS